MAYKEELTLNATKQNNYKLYDRFISLMNNESSSGFKPVCNDNDLFGGFLGSLSKKYDLGK